MKEVGEQICFNFSAGEILLVDKPYRWTSSDVVCKIRNALKPLKLKVGHAGTLDPLATGLLIICTGPLTKKIDDFQSQDKEYEGTMMLGATTPSYDAETEIDQRFDAKAITPARLKETLPYFIGHLAQYPPMYSAVKLDGERLYLKARRGESPLLRKRTIQITSFDLTRIELPEIDFRIRCSKGTYIRSLVHDFGKALQNGAYLSQLKRTKNGPYELQSAFRLEDLIDHITTLKERGILT